MGEMRQSTKNAVMSCLDSPRTFLEMADMTGVSYHTCRRYTVELMKMGLVKELPMRSPEGRLLYMRANPNDVDELYLYWQGEHKIAGTVIAEMLKGYLPFNYMGVLSSYLAYLFSRSLRQGQNEGKSAMDPARALEGTIEPLIVKERIRAALPLLRDTLNVLEQCLLEDALWQDNAKVAQLMSPVEPDMRLMLEAGRAVMEREDARRASGNGNGQETGE